MKWCITYFKADPYLAANGLSSIRTEIVKTTSPGKWVIAKNTQYNRYIILYAEKVEE